MAIALNSLKPKYSVTEAGNVYVKLNMLEQQFSTDVLSALVQAALVVKKDPRHEE